MLGPFAVFVSRDPERAWARIAPHALHAAGMYPVVTPDQCVQLGATLGDDAPLNFHPLVSGLDPALGWESLELFGAEVRPRLRAHSAEGGWAATTGWQPAG